MSVLRCVPVIRSLVDALIARRDCGTLQALRLASREVWLLSAGALPRAVRACLHRSGWCGADGCRCDCVSMRRHRVRSAVRNWRCSSHGFGNCCWGYTSAEYREFRRLVCARCYDGHWVRTGVRPLVLCLRPPD